MSYYDIKPEEIEKKSFEMISEILKESGKTLDEKLEHIIKRVIHTTADFEYADSLFFSDGVAETITAAIKNGAHIVTDTNMAKSGINEKKLRTFGGVAHCFMADENVAKRAKEQETTRATVCMERAAELDASVVVAIGNAPTAVKRICELKEAGQFNPVAVIGVPVGFVNVLEAKELLMLSGIPCIVSRGRKGGSNVAAAIINAILYRA